MTKYSFKRNESFYIREGWLEKAINTIYETQRNIFHKNDGIEYLGIGSNMVKSLKYWLNAAEIIEGKDSNLTEFGFLLHKFDPYLDNKFSWQLIHANLVKNEQECLIFNYIFTKQPNSFIKNELSSSICDYIESKGEKSNRKYIEADLNVFTRSYVNEEIVENPENNYNCPLAQLKLLKKEGNIYRKTRPSYNSLSYLVIYYLLEKIYKGKAFDIDDAFEKEESPSRLFNLDKYMFMQFLEDMRKNGLVTINKTAGLNTVYFEKKIDINEVFEEYYK